MPVLRKHPAQRLDDQRFLAGWITCEFSVNKSSSSGNTAICGRDARISFRVIRGSGSGGISSSSDWTCSQKASKSSGFVTDDTK